MTIDISFLVINHKRKGGINMIAYIVSHWYIYLIAILFSITLALSFELLFPKIFPSFTQNIKSTQIVDLVITPITGLYSLLLALVIVNSWQHFFRTQELVSREASAMALVTHIRSTYSEAKHNNRLTKAIDHYIRFLPNNVLPPIAGKNDALEFQSSYDLLDSLNNFNPETKVTRALFARLEAEITKSIDAKRERLSLHNKLPGPILTILFSGGIMLLFFLCIVSKERKQLHFILGTIFVASLIGFYLALIIDLNTTNAGDIGYLNLSASPYIEEIIKQLQS